MPPVCPQLVQRGPIGIGHHQHPLAAGGCGLHGGKQRLAFGRIYVSRRPCHADDADGIGAHKGDRCGLGRLPQSADLEPGAGHGWASGMPPF